MSDYYYHGPFVGSCSGGPTIDLPEFQVPYLQSVDITLLADAEGMVHGMAFNSDKPPVRPPPAVPPGGWHAAIVMMDDNLSPSLIMMECDVPYGADSGWVGQLARALAQKNTGEYVIDCDSRPATELKVSVSRHTDGPDEGAFKRTVHMTCPDGASMSMVVPNDIALQAASDIAGH